jgi:predicted Zn-dependent protease with MMP-like domain
VRCAELGKFVVERRLLESVAEGNDPRMLGFFSGVPYPEKTTDSGVPHLDCVFLYQRNIERSCKSRDEAAREIRVTLLHETGHFFGLSEDELHVMGLG